jgi:hypothetical protein
MAQPTQDWFQESINAYNDYKVNVISPLLTEKADGATNLEIEVEAGEVSQESLELIATKKDEELDKTEKKDNPNPNLNFQSYTLNGISWKGDIATLELELKNKSICVSLLQDVF